MKKVNFWKKAGMTLMTSCVALCLMAASCNPDPDPDPEPDPTPTPTPVNPTPDPTPTPSSGDTWASLINETPHEAVVNGNTLTYGDHVYTVNGEIELSGTVFNIPTAYVTFTNIPSGYTEFEAVYNNLLGKSIQGTAAMVPMAIEMYARDATLGERCLTLLCNGTATVNEITRTLKQKFNYSPYSPDNDQYVQRYLPAALLKGATYTNGYAPIEPYTVEMCRSANAPQDAPLTGGTVYYTYILTSGGWDTFQRGVEVFLPYGNNSMYKVFNCPACYTQCRTIQNGPWQGLK